MGNITVSVPDKNARNLGDDDYDESFVFTGVIDNEIHSGKEITLVGGDKDSDIAVLKLDLSSNKKVSKEDIVECQVPDSDYTPRQGEEVFAIGNPSGILPMTVSVGVISYIDRAVTVNSVGDMTLLQIDVQTNHGSSGGGLFNCYGELIGITNSGSDEYDGLNYAVPHKNYYVEDSGFITIAKQLIATKTEDNYGYISGKWILGITVKEQKKENGELYLQVESVEVASNADSAGIRKGDIIASVEYDGKKVDITGNASLSSALYEIRKTHGFGKDMKGEFFISVYTKENQEYVLYKRTLAIKKEYIFCDTGVYAEA
jgi:S1-C subfamily serine protease